MSVLDGPGLKAIGAVVVLVALPALSYNGAARQDGRRTANVHPEPHTSADPYVKGRSLSIPGIDWTAAPKTVLIFLSATCQYCVESMPFVRELTSSSPVPPDDAQMIVVTTEPAGTMKAFLAAHGVTPTRMITLGVGDPLPRVVPTVVLLTPNGTVAAVWSGEQTRSRQRAILDVLRGPVS